MVVEFIDTHRDRFGVEPICRVLSQHGVPIAPRSYYAAKRRPISARAIRDEALAVRQNLDSVPRFHDIMREQADISANDGRDWRMFIIRAYGVDIPQNRARCPNDARGSTRCCASS